MSTMNASDIQIGMRVVDTTNNMTAVVHGKPEYYNSRSKLVRIKYENSTRFCYQINNLMEPLPQEEQYVALGGTYVKPEGDF